MRRLTPLFLLLFLLAFSACASAQTFSGFAWTEVSTTPVEAQTNTYKVYYDNTQTGLPITNVVCGGLASPFTCSGVNVAPSGQHTAALTAALPDGSAESLPSTAITFVQGPATPTGVQPKK